MASHSRDDRAPNSADADLSRPKVSFETQRRLAALLLRGKLEQEYGGNRPSSAPPGKLTFGEEDMTPPTSADSDFAVLAALRSSSLKQLLRLGSLSFDRVSANAASPTRRSAGDKTPRNENGPGRDVPHFTGRGAESPALGHHELRPSHRETKMLTASVLSPQLHRTEADFLNVAIPSQGALNGNHQDMPVSAPLINVAPHPMRRKTPSPGGGGALEVRVQRAPSSAVTDFGEFPAARENAQTLGGRDTLGVGPPRSPRSAFTDFGEFPAARGDEAELGGLRRLRSPRGPRPDLHPNTPSHRDQFGQLASGNPYGNLLSASPFPWDARTPTFTPTLGDRAFWLDKFVPPERPRSTPPPSMYLPGEEEQQPHRPEGFSFTEAREMNGRSPMRSPSGPPASMVPQVHISQASPLPHSQASPLPHGGERISGAEHVAPFRRREPSYHEGHSIVPVVSVSPVSPERGRQQRSSADYPSTSRRQHPQQSVPSSAPQVVVNAPVARQSKSPISAKAKSPTAGVPGKFANQWNAVLEDFRTNKGRQYELRHIAGFVAWFAGDQNGSRFIQQKLETATDEEKAATFNEILPCALQLATDTFGNYVIQKLFEFGTEAQRVALAKQIAGYVLPLTLQMYGCRVIQKALEYLPRGNQLALLRELEGEVVGCVKDQNGNHVIQKAVDCLPSEQIPFIFGAFVGQVGHLSAHPYGCRVVQRILVRCQEDEKRSRLLQELHQLTTTLAVDQYGNYVVQHILQHGTAADRSAVIAKVKEHVAALSTHKFASNVVEKCLAYGTREDRHALIEEVLSPLPEGECALTIMMKDKFANYVVQRILDVVEGEQRNRILDATAQVLPALRKIAHGKHIISRVEKLARAINYPLSQAPPPSFGGR